MYYYVEESLKRESDSPIKDSPYKCHEHMNRDWESQLNCLYYDNTKLKKEEGS
jgi:hypothetical protein